MTTSINSYLKTTKYAQLAEYLRQEIDAGRFQPGDRLPSLNDLKEQFGANQHTVERAHTLLENDGLIRREPGRGVFVNHPIQRQLTGNVGFVTPISHLNQGGNLTYWGSILTGMQRAARERNYHLLLIDEGDDFERWDKVDGVVYLKAYIPQPPAPAMPKLPSGFPAVSIFGEIPGIPCITSDDLDGVYQCTQRLIQQGHRHIAYLAQMGEAISWQLKQRKAGYIKALTEAGIDPDTRYRHDLQARINSDGTPSWYQDAGELSMRGWLEKDWMELECTALIAQNDGIAKGAIRAFEAAGLQVPRDVSVVGFDGLLTESSTPRLTTIEVPLQEIGQHAIELLLDWLKAPAQTPQNVCLPIHLIEGQTTAPPLGVVPEHALITA